MAYLEQPSVAAGRVVINKQKGGFVNIILGEAGGCTCCCGERCSAKGLYRG